MNYNDINNAVKRDIKRGANNVSFKDNILLFLTSKFMYGGMFIMSVLFPFMVTNAFLGWYSIGFVMLGLILANLFTPTRLYVYGHIESEIDTQYLDYMYDVIGETNRYYNISIVQLSHVFLQYKSKGEVE